MIATRAAMLRRLDWTPLLAAALILLLVAIGGSLSDRFARSDNLANVLEQCTATGFAALGQTFVILAGGIDFSVGGVASLCSVLLAGLPEGQDAMFWPVLALVLLLGIAIGLVNGLVMIRLRVNPLIVTLGSSSVLQGLALLYRNHPGGSAPDAFQDLAFAHIGGIPVTALLLVVAFAIAFVFLGQTRPGRDIYAVGDDPAAARLSGVGAERALLIVYAVSGCLAAMTGAYLVSRTGVGDPRAGIGLELSSITPVVVGGTVLSGGRGGVIGTLLGVLLLTLLNNLLNFLDISSYVQWIVQGVIVIAAVSASSKGARE